MKVKYCGGRSRMDVSFNRRSYNFTHENNRTLDINEQQVINYIFGLPNRQEFEAVNESVTVKDKESETVKKENKLECKLCSFTASSEQGLKVHNSIKHKKGGK